MKGTDLQGLTVTALPAASNGTHRTTKRNGAAPKRSAGSGPRADAQPSPQPFDTAFAAAFATGFCTIEAELIDAPKWPLHSAAWFQPELAPTIPVRSGLAIERRNRIPAPDFLHSDITPSDRPEGLNSSADALTPGARRELPQSGLAPLGWDPRALCRKQGGE